MSPAAIALLCAALALPAASPDPGWSGAWEGELAFPRAPVVATVLIVRDGGATSAAVEARGGSEPAERLVLDGATIRFELPAGDGGRLRFEGRRARDRIAGEVVGPRPLDRARFELRRLPVLPKPRDRVEAWSQDLDALEARFLRYDRSFSRKARARFRAAVAALRRELPMRTDAEVIAAIARATALSGNAHTRLYLVRNRTEVRRAPIRLWSFRDGVHVVRATPEHRALVGLRLVAIGGTPIAEAERRVADLYAGNLAWRRYLAAYLLTSPDLLAAVGLVEDPDRPVLTFERRDGTTLEAVVPPLPLRRTTKPVEAWWDLAPEHQPEGERWVPALAPEAAPLVLRRPGRHYLAESVAGGRALYVRYDRAAEDAHEPFAAFAARTLETLRAREWESVIVDLRHNTGGDLGIARDFFDALAAEVRGRARLHVVTGRATFSAGLFHAAQLRSVPGAVFSGEAPGDALDYWSEGGNVILPNSRLAAHFANGFHSYSAAPHPGVTPHTDLAARSLAPDRVVEPTFAEYAAGRDPVLEAILGTGPQP
jgi:hypothetical protein